MEFCPICNSELKISNSVLFGKGKLSDTRNLCANCYRKINNINPALATHLETIDSEKAANIIEAGKAIKIHTPKENVKAVVFAIILIGICLFGLVKCFSSDSENIEVKTFTNEDAFYKSVGCVSSILKAPKTATFCMPQEAVIIKDNDSTYQILGHVDAENSYGAMLRSKFRTTIIHNNTTGNTYCIDARLVDY